MNLIGINPDYLQTGELIRPTDVVSRVVSLKRGSFYESGLVIKDAETGLPFTDFAPITLDVDLCRMSAQVVYKQLEFVNGLDRDVYVTYYYVDPTDADSREDLDSSIAALDDPREDLEYKFIKGVSTTDTPSEHAHDAHDIYDLEQVVASIFAVFKHNGNGVEDLLDVVLAKYQTKTDNRLITVDKSLVGAINELRGDVSGIDLTTYQKRRDTNLITQSQNLNGAINELHARIATLSSGGLGSLDMSGELVGSGTIDLNDQMNAESKVWVVNATLTIKGDFGDGVSTANVGVGDVIYYDAETDKLLVQYSGSNTNSKLDKEPGGLVTTATNAGAAVAEVYRLIAAMSGVDSTNPLLGIVTSDIDLTATSQTGNGYYVIGKNDTKVTANFGVVEQRTMNVGQVLNYSHSTTRYSEGTGTAPGQGTVTTGLSLLEEHFKFVDGLNYVYDRIMQKVGSDTDAIESMGSITGNVDLTGFKGSEMWMAYGNYNVTAIFSGETTPSVREVYSGDVLYRKRSEGVIYVNSVGEELASYLDQTPAGLNAGSANIATAMLQTAQAIKSVDGNGTLLSSATTLAAPASNTEKYVIAVNNITVTAPFTDESTSKTLVAGQVVVSAGTNTTWDVDHIDNQGVDKQGAYSQALVSPNKHLVAEINTLLVNSQGTVSVATGDLIKTARPVDAAYALPCDGNVYNVSDYPDLAALVGSVYGGDGTTTFAVPTAPSDVSVDGFSPVDVHPADAGSKLNSQEGYPGVTITQGQKRIAVFTFAQPSSSSIALTFLDLDSGEKVSFAANYLKISNAFNEGRGLNPCKPAVIHGTDQMILVAWDYPSNQCKLVLLDLSGDDVFNPTVIANDPRFVYDSGVVSVAGSTYVNSVYYNPQDSYIYITFKGYSSDNAICRAHYNPVTKDIGGIAGVMTNQFIGYNFLHVPPKDTGEMLVHHTNQSGSISWWHPTTKVFTAITFAAIPGGVGSAMVSAVTPYKDGYAMVQQYIQEAGYWKVVRVMDSSFVEIKQLTHEFEHSLSSIDCYDNRMAVISGGAYAGTTLGAFGYVGSFSGMSYSIKI